MDIRLFSRGLEPAQEGACRILVRQGWLDRSNDNVLQIHPLIRKLVRERFSPDGAGFQGFLDRFSGLAEPAPMPDSLCWTHMGTIRWTSGAGSVGAAA